MTNSLRHGVSMAVAGVLVLGALGHAQTFTTLYNFTGGSDGGYPYAGVIQDPTGNLYGTTECGGDLNCNDGGGVVYKVNTAGTGTVLHAFTGYQSDGANTDAPVVRDKAGNIYGTTSYGGAANYGIVFKIDTAGNETVLYSFTGSPDSCYPNQGLVTDKAGNLYGTTTRCGASGYGTIFKVDSAGNFALLHSFTGGDGAYPAGGHLTMDRSGNLYGVADMGGVYDAGVLYELSSNGTFTVLHSFGGASDGCYPSGSVTMDSAGSLYGTTTLCGSNGDGTIWKTSKKGKETILHSFAGGTSDGCFPYAGVARDSKGNLHGVTYTCGANNDGALYKLSACRKLTLLHSFDHSDGNGPRGEVLWTDKGTSSAPPTAAAAAATERCGSTCPRQLS